MLLHLIRKADLKRTNRLFIQGSLPDKALSSKALPSKSKTSYLHRLSNKRIVGLIESLAYQLRNDPLLHPGQIAGIQKRIKDLKAELDERLTYRAELDATGNPDNLDKAVQRVKLRDEHPNTKAQAKVPKSANHGHKREKTPNPLNKIRREGKSSNVQPKRFKDPLFEGGGKFKSWISLRRKDKI